MAHTVKTPLRRSFSEHVKDSTNKAWDIFWRSAREKRLSEIEAKEACDWLRAAGFPQYAQLFKDSHFPIDIEWVKNDHEFLDTDAVDSLCRRLATLNKCAEMKLELSRFKRRIANNDDEEPYAISPKWSYDRKNRRWIRTNDMDFFHSVASPTSNLRRSESFEASLSDSSEHHEILSTHSSSSADSEDGTAAHKAAEDPETSRSSSRCSSTYKPLSPDSSCSGPPSPGEAQSFSSEEQFHERPQLKKGQSLLRKMDQLRLRGSTLRPHGQGRKSHLVISSPVLQQGLGEDKLKELDCLDLASLQHNVNSPSSYSPPSDSSSSASENSSAMSTPSPVSKVRSNCKRLDIRKEAEEHGCDSEQDLHNQRNLNVNPVFEIPHGHKPGTFPTTLSHNAIFSPSENTSVNWRTGSFHGYRGRRCRSSTSKEQEPLCSPLAAYDHRVSIYDNVPDHQMQITDDDVFSALDSVMERISGLQQLVTSWTEKLSEDGDSDFSQSSSHSPSSLTDIHIEIKEPGEADRTGLEQIYDKSSKTQSHTVPPTECPSCPQKLYWSCEQTLSTSKTRHGIEAQLTPNISKLQRLSLLRLTALMDKHSPFSKQGWNWTVPRVYRKTKASDNKSRKVFGVPLLHSVQQSGKPLPPSILRAMEYLKTQCLDQVGLFRKSGVKSRIQYLRDMVEADPDGTSFDGQSAFDVADMLKQYFRDLPEPIFSNKLCETFLHIYQYFPKDQQFTASQAAIFLLPDENREALQSLLFFLQEVVACVEENQMTPTNIAVCLAPSLFHLNVVKRDSTSSRSSHRKYSLGRPDQRDLSENLAATQGLAQMVAECTHLFQMPHYWEEQNIFNEDSLNVDTSFSSSPQREGAPDLTDRSRLDLSVQQLLREAREKPKGWITCSTCDHVDVAFKKVEDGYPLAMWRGAVEVDAPQQDVLQRVLREQGQWQSDLQHCEVVETLDKNAEVYRYTLEASGARPALQHVLLRTWHSEPSSGPLFVASTSVEHPDVPARGGVTAQVLCCLFLVEPMGAKRSRLVHFCRTDTRGRSPEWHNKVAGHLLSSTLVAIRDSFRPKTKDSR